jgi:hypothetical protein
MTRYTPLSNLHALKYAPQQVIKFRCSKINSHYPYRLTLLFKIFVNHCRATPFLLGWSQDAWITDREAPRLGGRGLL